MRLIDADTLKAEFTGNFHELWHYTGVRALIDVAPTVEAAPVVHAHWIVICTHPNGEKRFTCSNQKCRRTSLNDYDFCPKCGAKMDEEIYDAKTENTAL